MRQRKSKVMQKTFAPANPPSLFDRIVVAARNGREDIIEDFKNSGALPDLNVPPNENTPLPLCEAVNCGSLNVIRLLRRLGASPNRRCPFYGKTAYELAADDVEAYRRLKIRRKKQTCAYFDIHTAIGYDDLEWLRKVAGDDFKPNFNFYYPMPPGFLFYSPLAYAVQSRSMRCARWLLEHGADPNRVCRRSQKKPLQMAKGRMRRMIEEFMRRGSA